MPATKVAKVKDGLRLVCSCRRGKAGGVKLCRDDREIEAAADDLLGRTLVTEQTGARDVVSWAVFLGSLGVSFVGLVALESSQVFGGRSGNRILSLPYMIAVGMGLHNLGEGLAIGASYASGEYTLSALLVAGFGLHNGTEGFGIVGAAGKTPMSWRDVFLLGLIAGLPTCVGTFLSGQGVSSYFSICFYALAAGSLLYVVLSLTVMSYTATRRVQVAAGIFAGISLMYVTAMVLALVSGVRS